MQKSPRPALRSHVPRVGVHSSHLADSLNEHGATAGYVGTGTTFVELQKSTTDDDDDELLVVVASTPVVPLSGASLSSLQEPPLASTFLQLTLHAPSKHVNGDRVAFVGTRKTQIVVFGHLSSLHASGHTTGGSVVGAGVRGNVVDDVVGNVEDEVDSEVVGSMVVAVVLESPDKVVE